MLVLQVLAGLEDINHYHMIILIKHNYVNKNRFLSEQHNVDGCNQNQKNRFLVTVTVTMN